MARENTIQVLRTTKANLNTQALAGNLIVGEPYFITDEARFAVASSTTTYTTYAKQSEIFTGVSSIQPGDYVTVDENDPDNPVINVTGVAPSNHIHAPATTAINGFMSALDKIKLDSLPTDGAPPDNSVTAAKINSASTTAILDKIAGVTSTTFGKSLLSQSNSAGLSSLVGSAIGGGSGTNRFIRFPSLGLQLCWGVSSLLTVSTTANAQGMFGSSSTVLTFPAAFNATPMCILFADKALGGSGGSGACWAFSTNLKPTPTQCEGNIFSFVNTGKAYLAYFAAGTYS